MRKFIPVTAVSIGCVIGLIFVHPVKRPEQVNKTMANNMAKETSYTKAETPHQKVDIPRQAEDETKTEEEKNYTEREFKLTAYCPCYECSEGYGKNTSTGVKARPNHTIAVDPSVIPYGTKVKIGDKTYKAEDCGGGIDGDEIDIYFSTHEETDEFGVQYQKVKIFYKK